MALGAWLGWHYVAYTLLGYGVGFIVSFTLNFVFTFKSTGAWKKRALRFLLVNLSLLTTVQIVQATLIEQLNIPEIYAVGSSMILYTILGFLLNKHFVFYSH